MPLHRLQADTGWAQTVQQGRLLFYLGYSFCNKHLVGPVVPKIRPLQEGEITGLRKNRVNKQMNQLTLNFPNVVNMIVGLFHTSHEANAYRPYSVNTQTFLLQEFQCGLGDECCQRSQATGGKPESTGEVKTWKQAQLHQMPSAKKGPGLSCYTFVDTLLSYHSTYCA